MDTTQTARTDAPTQIVRLDGPRIAEVVRELPTLAAAYESCPALPEYGLAQEGRVLAVDAVHQALSESEAVAEAVREAAGRAAGL